MQSVCEVIVNLNVVVFLSIYLFLFCVFLFVFLITSLYLETYTLKDAKVYLHDLNCRRRMAETKGTGGCPRDAKLRRMGPPTSCLSISGISVCAIRLGLRRLEDGRPRDGCPRDGCP